MSITLADGLLILLAVLVMGAFLLPVSVAVVRLWDEARTAFLPSSIRSRIVEESTRATKDHVEELLDQYEPQHVALHVLWTDLITSIPADIVRVGRAWDRVVL